VLAYPKQATDATTKVTNLTTGISQTIAETREIFKKNLEEKCGFEIEVHESSQFKTNITFFLLHLPFEELEKHANRLQINKRIAQDYILLVDQVFKSNSMTSLHAQLTDKEKEALAEEICQVENDIANDKSDTANDLIDDFDEINSKAGIPCLSGLKKCFDIDDKDLARLPSYFTTIYEKELRHLFHGVYKSDGSLNEDGFFTPAERSKIADYLIRECHYIDTADKSQEEIKTSIDFGIERLMGVVGCLIRRIRCMIVL